MKTLLIRGTHQPPAELRAILERGSTAMDEVDRAADAGGRQADRVVEWTGRDLLVGDRRLRWPEDEDEVRMFFQTGG